MRRPLCYKAHKYLFRRPYGLQSRPRAARASALRPSAIRAACGGSLPCGRRAALSAFRGRRAAKHLPAVSERFQRAVRPLCTDISGIAVPCPAAQKAYKIIRRRRRKNTKRYRGNWSGLNETKRNGCAGTVLPINKERAYELVGCSGYAE